MTNTRKDDPTKNIIGIESSNIIGNSRDLIKALKKGIKNYCTPSPGTFLERSRGLSARVQAAKINIARLDELEKIYGNSEIPKKEIMACLISTGPAFTQMVYKCFEQFETEAFKYSSRSSK